MMDVARRCRGGSNEALLRAPRPFFGRVVWALIYSIYIFVFAVVSNVDEDTML